MLFNILKCCKTFSNVMDIFIYLFVPFETNADNFWGCACQLFYCSYMMVFHVMCLTVVFFWVFNADLSSYRDICISFHSAVWSPDWSPWQTHLLCVLVEHCSSSDSDSYSNCDGWLDHEYILGDGHGHSCQ